jgi:hypothetical protein
VWPLLFRIPVELLLFWLPGPSYFPRGRLGGRAGFGAGGSAAARPSASSRAIASERLQSLAAAHFSMPASTSFGTRADTAGSWPVAGLPRPRFFLSTDIDFAMKSVYIKSSPKAREMEMKTEPRKLCTDLTPAEREQAERIGSLPAGQKIKTAWDMRVEKFIPSRTQH